MKPILELAVFNPEAALLAASTAADRLELCAGYAGGGLTPSVGTMRVVREQVRNIPIYVMIRPREGDFVYSENELAIMRHDILAAKELKMDGIVCGALTDKNEINETVCQKLVQLAHPLPVTFHRAFDCCVNPTKAIEVLIRCGAKRVLTSGQKTSAMEGSALLADLVKLAGDRIIIMPGAGITAGNIHLLRERTKAVEFHTSAKKMDDTKNTFGFGDSIMPDAASIIAMKAALNRQTR
ncbi:MAG: copper homeostasis protein CutC [Bacteroidia bacterium]